MSKICIKCGIEKQIDLFDRSYSECKKCRKNSYIKKKIEQRLPFRAKLKESCDKEEITDEQFNKFFVPFEKYEIMKSLPDLYTFLECSELQKLDNKYAKSDYDNKIFLKAVFCSNNKEHTTYIIHII